MSAKVKIEKGVPVPELYLTRYNNRKRPKPRELKYPFKLLEVGDSFLVPVFKDPTGAHQISHRCHNVGQ